MPKKKRKTQTERWVCAGMRLDAKGKPFYIWYTAEVLGDDGSVPSGATEFHYVKLGGSAGGEYDVEVTKTGVLLAPPYAGRYGDEERAAGWQVQDRAARVRLERLRAEKKARVQPPEIELALVTLRHGYNAIPPSQRRGILIWMNEQITRGGY